MAEGCNSQKKKKKNSLVCCVEDRFVRIFLE